VQAHPDGDERARDFFLKEARNSAVRAGPAPGKPKRRCFVQKFYSLGRDQKSLSAGAAFDAVDAWLRQPSVTAPERTHVTCKDARFDPAAFSV
jgi:hypothetical protein